MALAVSVQVLPNQWGVRLTASGATGTVTWVRTVQGRDTVVGQGAVILDQGTPLNTAVTYSATDSAALAVAEPVTLEASQPVLSSLMSSDVAVVRVVSWRPVEAVGRSMWHPVIDRMDPLVSVYPMLYPSGELVLLAADYVERRELGRMLMPGDVMLLRSHDERVVDSMTFIANRWSDPNVDQDQRDEGPVLLTIPYQRVSDLVDWAPDADRTYSVVRSEAGTYLDLERMYPTYRMLQDGQQP